ncbi:hypothetical protein GQY29_03765 [Streptococcus thermophilus]|nr:hypothetical protein GQY29_03765 [Streptococcus thermophilus]
MLDIYNTNNLNENGFPSVWIATEILMFGNLVYLIYLINKTSKKSKRISSILSLYNKRIVIVD